MKNDKLKIFYITSIVNHCFSSILKYITLFTLNISFTSLSYATEINLNTIVSNTDNAATLKAIAQDIINNPEKLNEIIDKIKKEHGPDAKKLWQKYIKISNQHISLVAQPNDAVFTKKSDFSTYIKNIHMFNKDESYPNLINLNTADLCDIIGKKMNTFYSEPEIISMAQTIKDAVNQGSYGPKPTGGQAEGLQENKSTPNHFSVTYTCAVGEKCSRNSKLVCQPAQNIVIIFEAKDYFDKIVSQGNVHAWIGKINKGKIVSIFQEKNDS